MEKKCKKAKWLSEEALQIAEERREVKGKGGRGRYNQVNGEFQRKVRRDGKNTQKNFTKKVFMTQITMMV